MITSSQFPDYLFYLVCYLESYDRQQLTNADEIESTQLASKIKGENQKLLSWQLSNSGGESHNSYATMNLISLIGILSFTINDCNNTRSRNFSYETYAIY